MGQNLGFFVKKISSVTVGLKSEFLLLNKNLKSACNKYEINRTQTHEMRSNYFLALRRQSPDDKKKQEAVSFYKTCLTHMHFEGKFLIKVRAEYIDKWFHSFERILRKGGLFFTDKPCTSHLL